MNKKVEKEGKHVRNSIFIAVVISFGITLLFVLQQFFPERFCPGIKPGEMQGMWGIWLYPFFHGNISHLLSNLPPLFFLMAGTFYYLPGRFFPAILSIWLFSAVIIWVAGRSGCHLGASGIIYGLAFMLATLGFLKKQRTLGAFALIIVFLYGGMIWGVLPQEGNVSWEGHAGGAVAGILLAVLWRKHAIYTDYIDQQPAQNGEADISSSDKNNGNSSASANIAIEYHYRPDKKK